MPAWMTWLLPLFYTCLGVALIWRTPVLRFSSLPHKWWMLLFLAKVLLGIAYTLIHQHYYSGVVPDIQHYFRDGAALFGVLQEKPSYFFQMFVWNPGLPIPEHLHLYFDRMYKWTVNGDYGMIRFNALCYFLSFGNYWVHVIIINFIAMLGLARLYEFFVRNAPLSRLALAGVLFGVPSVLFYSSGVHKAALVLFAVGIIVYYTWKWLSEQPRWIYLLWIGLAFGMLGLLRLYILLALLPGWLICMARPSISSKYATAAMAGAYLVGLLLVNMGLQRCCDQNVWEKVVEKRVAFQTLSGQSNLSMQLVAPNAAQVLWVLPEGLAHFWLRPYVWEVQSILPTLISVENMVVLLLVLVLLYQWIRAGAPPGLLESWLLAYGVVLMLLIGVTVSNAGAIARYKAQWYPVVLPALVLLAQAANSKRINRKGAETQSIEGQKGR